MISFQIIFAFILLNWTTALLTHKQLDNTTMITEPDNDCACEQFTCGCCDQINLFIAAGKLCSSVSYLDKDYGVRLTLTWNDVVIVNKTVSARNPPPICFDIPELEKIAAVCFQFYDLDVEENHFKGCMELKIVLLYLVSESIRIGCITIPDDIKTSSFFSSKKNQLNEIEKESKYLSRNRLPQVILI